MTKALFPDLIVNGELVPHSCVAAEVQNHHAPSGKPGLAWRKAAKAIAVRTLLLQEAQQRGLDTDPQEVAPGQVETKEEALIRGLLQEAIVPKAPSEDDVHQEWQKDPQRFRAPPLWEVSHILVACDPRDKEATETARLKAVKIAEQAQANPKAFANLAKEVSDCGSKSEGGFLGQLSPGDTVPEFEQILHGLSEGQITSEPMLTRHGYHIVRLDAVAWGETLPFESVRHKIAHALEKAAWTKAAQNYVAQLIEAAEITGVDLKQH